MSQPTLFDCDAPTGAYGQPVEPTPSAGWATDAEQARLTGQRGQIYQRLLQGPATNAELAAITHRFGARIKELRDGGIAIAIIENDRATGRVTYALA